MGRDGRLYLKYVKRYHEYKMIFSIHYFFAEGKKVKGMVRNDVFGGWGM